MQGWIKLHRRIMDHWLYLENRIFSRYEAWLDLVLLASYEDTKILLGGETINIERGTLVTSELRLMQRWRWSKSKVRRFLDLLEADGMIKRETGQRWTIIRVLNYETYQGGPDEPQRGTKKRKRAQRRSQEAQKQSSMIDRLSAAQEWIEQGGDPYEFRPDD